MKEYTVVVILLILALIPAGQTAGNFDITLSATNGTLYQTVCNTQTTLEFQFSVSSTLAGATQTPLGLSSSTFKFLDVYGNDLVLPLTNANLDSSPAATSFVNGYGSRISSSANSVTPQAAYIFQFSDGTNTVNIYIPVTTTSNTASTDNPDVLNLKLTSDALGTFSISNTASPLTSFNMLNQNIYNQWYTANSGLTTMLVSNFIYIITSKANAVSASPTWATFLTTSWNANIQSNGNKLCFGSTAATGVFQTHMRESVPLWFAWIWIFIYWLFYLLSNATNVKVYDKRFEENTWTCMALYSLYHLAHEECFTRLSRSSVLLINWSIQGVIIASIIGNQYLGAPMIIWTAAVAFVATIPIPFFLGGIFFKKIYEKNLLKYESLKNMKGTFDKSKIEPFEAVVDTCEQKLYGYYHWFYSLAFVVFFVCWPIAINQMQSLSRLNYHYHWYWLAAMGIVFILEHLIFEPILALCFGDRQIVRNRGGFFYNFKLGQMARSAQIF